ncbi:MAG: hypothetical protein ACRDQ5_24515, partial [Sciscionella sp.]
RALVAVALFAPGQALTDLQLSNDLSRSTRPDLVLPDSLAPPSAAGGLWLLLAGHLLAALAGVLVLVLLREPSGERGDLGAGAAGRAAPVHWRQPGGDPLPVAWGKGRIAVLASIGMLAGIALLLSEPFESDNVYLLSGSVLEQPALAFVGGLLLVVAAPVAAVFAAGAETASGCRGGLYGVTLGLLSFALPQLVSGLTVDGLHPTWGPVLVVLAAVAFGVLGWLYGRQDPATDVDRFDGDEPAELRLPDLSRLQVIAGLLGLLAGLSAVAAGLSRQVVFPPRLPQLASYSDRLLMPAGLLVGVLGLVLLAGAVGRSTGPSGLATAVRPALLVASLAAVPLAAAEAMDGALAATEIDGVRVAAGPWLTVLALLAALLAAGFAGVAGGVEREDVDISEHAVRVPVLVAGLLAGLLAVGAFAFPVLRAPDYSAPALSVGSGVGWWGLVVALVTIVLAAVLAAFSRPARGSALLLGAAGVLAVHLLEFPLTSARVRDAEVGPGLWFAVAGLIVLLAAAGVAVVAGGARFPVTSRSASRFRRGHG